MSDHYPGASYPSLHRTIRARHQSAHIWKLYRDRKMFPGNKEAGSSDT